MKPFFSKRHLHSGKKPHLHFDSSGVSGISWGGTEAAVVVVVLGRLAEPVVVVVLESVVVVEALVVVVELLPSLGRSHSQRASHDRYGPENLKWTKAKLGSVHTCATLARD